MNECASWQECFEGNYAIKITTDKAIAVTPTEGKYLNMCGGNY